MTPNGDKLEELDLLNETSDLYAKLQVAKQLLRRCLHPVNGVRSYRLEVEVKSFLERKRS